MTSPADDAYSDYVIFVDESGDHGLSNIDPNFPIFVLNFCIFRKDHYINSVVPALQSFKFRWFGHDVVILHEHDIVKQRPPFVFLQNPIKRDGFIQELTAIMERAEFTLISAVIDKRRLLHRYARPENPYGIGLRFCMERTWAFLREHAQELKQTAVIVERRGKREDDELELTFRRVCDGANRWGLMPSLRFVPADKRVNSSGLQLADLTARPIGRHVLAPQQPNRAYEIIATKLRRSPAGKVEGWGLKVFP
ncbi:MAG TPA: DUF3800 domain-containing protein [Geminicoccus sp.]|uniref:DUF3800 domain-containing protein n=1 Tax=Geminicoccus sp. TaxID=2024832 RepID=UPI002BD96763|nr:DUF3800 domain-containing protein [Geminicoccus sp.]HWL71743.1 DUF3800 domain-containing protein [Geminicoccus sp.]